MGAGLITLGSNTKVEGNLTTGGNLNPQGSLAFSNYGGGGLSANIHSLALHAATGNGQIILNTTKTDETDLIGFFVYRTTLEWL